MGALLGLDCRAMIATPITGDVIHIVVSVFVDDTDLYCWEESLKTVEELFEKSMRKHMLGEIS